MPAPLLKSITCILIFSVTCGLLTGQNLVPNYSFDTISACPFIYGFPGPTLAPPWVAPTDGTPDYFNVCATNPQFGVPANYVGYQYPLAGDGYFGMISYGSGTNLREYLTAPLFQPLVADTWYEVSFYINLANPHCGINKFGAYFSYIQPYLNNFHPLNFDPQVEANQGFLNDTVGWELVIGCFQAQGGEQYITLGNFYTDAETQVESGCGTGIAYLLIENVTVVETTEPEIIPLDLGGSASACISYLIDPGISGYTFLWEDGSTGPTLEVDASGTYSLTITDGCDYGIDSIEVTILSTLDPIDIGPPQIILCDGDSYTITLDPALSDYEWQDGTNGPDYIITAAGIYSVTLNDGCSEVSDVIEVMALAPPAPFDLGDNQNLCQGDELNILFDPLLGDFIWQDNSTTSTYTISTGGTYSLTISNMCGMETDEIIITSLDIPDVSLGLDNQIMCAWEIIELELDPSLGDILWPDGSNGPIFQITQPGIYIAYISNECGTGSDQVNVTFVEVPVIELGPDTILCTGDTFLLSAPGNTGVFQWQDNSQNDTFFVTSPGLYALSITNFCGSETDAILVDYLPGIIAPDLGPDLSLCPGEQITLFANTPFANYLWQDLSSADSFLVTTAGTYTLQVSNSCGQEADTIVISVHDNSPQVILPDQISLCQGDSVTLDAQSGNVSYLWNDNSQNQQLLITTPGTYSVTVSNACGTDVDTTIILDGGPAPMVALGNDFEICLGETVIIAPVFSNVDTWLWHDNSTLPTFTASGAGTITVEVSNSCSTDYDTLVVSLLQPVPSLDLGPDTAICSGEPLLLFINTPGVSILWPDGSSSSQYSVPGPGLFYATIFNECGQSYDTILVNALPEIPALDLGTDQSLCPGEVITISPGIANVNYLWHDGSTNSSYQTNAEESIILTITNECGSNTDTLEIVESTQGPQVDLGNDILECEGATVTIPSGISGVDYLWQDGSANAQYVTTQSGVFILQVSNNCGTDSDTILVDISGVPPAPVLGPDTTLCEGISLVLSSAANAETAVEWQDGSTSLSYTVSAAGIFILDESNRCGDASDTIVISYLDAPDPFTLGHDTTLCPGESIILTSPSTSFEIQWQNGSHQPMIIADQAGVYSLQLSNECGSVTDAITVDYDTRIPQLSLDSTISWCEGDIITLDATQPFVAEYLWSTGASSPSIQITSPGQYVIDISMLCNVASQNVDIIPGVDCMIPKVYNNIYIPNVFSPNDDGINDVFSVSVGSDLQVTSMHGSIYDRWGNLVYSDEAIPFIWDGYFAEEIVMPGVYVYRIKVKYIDQGVETEVVLAGDVTLVR